MIFLHQDFNSFLLGSIAPGQWLKPVQDSDHTRLGCVPIKACLLLVHLPPVVRPLQGLREKPCGTCLPPPPRRPLTPWPSEAVRGAARALSAHLSFLESTDAPKVLLPSPGFWISNSSLPHQLSHILTDFLVVLREKFVCITSSPLSEVADPLIIIILFYSDISPLKHLFPRFDLNAWPDLLVVGHLLSINSFLENQV